MDLDTHSMGKKKPTPHKEEKSEDYLEQLQRLQAEFENYQKRVQKEQEERSRYASQEVLRKLLSLVDAFEEALKSMQQEDEHSKGVKLLHKSLLKVLEEEGVKEMDVAGKQFNPVEQEVMAKTASEEEEGTVVEVVQKGYLYKDRVLRHAKVRVSSGKA